jgi:hypothetical protein
MKVKTHKLTWELTTRGHTKKESAHYETREKAQRVADDLVARGLVDYQPEIEESEI